MVIVRDGVGDGEFLLFKESALRIPETATDISRPIYEAIRPLYDEYILFGGFPEVVLKSSAEEKSPVGRFPQELGTAFIYKEEKVYVEKQLLASFAILR